jgi:hypothetical protein
MSGLTPAQRALLKQIEKSPTGLPVEIVHNGTLEGLERRGLVRRYTAMRTVPVDMVRLNDDMDGGDAA